MLRIFILALLLPSAFLMADDPSKEKLAAPAGWGGETITLPPGFAPDMKLKGFEHIRFAPGMMKPESDSFFSYAFVFELEPKPELTEELIKEEFLKYYGGLCKAVLNGAIPDLDPSKFAIHLERAKDDARVTSDEKNARTFQEYTGTLNWIEPFASKKPQMLNLEIQTWTSTEKNYIFVCVSPQVRDAKIWKQLRKIREDYFMRAHPTPQLGH